MSLIYDSSTRGPAKVELNEKGKEERGGCENEEEEEDPGRVVGGKEDCAV